MKNKSIVVLIVFFPLLVINIFCQEYSLLNLNPTLKIYKIESEHFDIYFPKEIQATAYRVKTLAEKRYEELSKYFHWKPEKKILVSLYNNYDFPNGFATVSPYNWIGIVVFPPNANSSISNYSDWLDIVITHELAHIFHLDQGRKLTKLLRKIFGRAPFLLTFPEFSNTPAFLEGIAVYSESKKTGFGRLNSSDYISYLKNNAIFDNFPPYDRVYGGTHVFPGPEIIYIYGSYLVNYIADKYGWDKIVKSIEKSSKEPIIYSPAFGLKKETGKFPPFHYKDLKSFYKKKFKNLKVRSEQVTDSGFWKYYLKGDNKGNFYYYRITPFEMPYIAKYSLKKREEEKLLDFYAISSLSISPDGNKLYFSAVNTYCNYSDVSDVYLYDLKERKLDRLSKGQSLFYPVEYNDGKLFAVKNNKNYSNLILFDLNERKIIKSFLRFQQISFPVFDKDGEILYFSAQNGESWDIYSYDLNNKKLLKITSDSNIERYLSFKNGKLYYVSVSKEGKNLVSFDPKTKKAEIILSPPIDLKSFVIRDNSIYFLSIFKNGIEILKDERKKESEKEIEVKEIESKDSVSKTMEQNLEDLKIKKANLLKFYKPTFWLPTYTKVDGRYLLGGMTLSTDPYFRNIFYGALYYNLKASKYPSGEFSLIHYLWYLPLNIYYKNIFSNNSYYGGYTERELKIGTFFSYGDYYKKLFTSLYYSLNNITGSPLGYKLAGLEFNINSDTSHTYPLSLGREDGFLLSAGYRRNMRILGSDYNVSEIFMNLRAYLKGMFRNQVVAINLAYYNSSGDVKIAHFVGGEEGYYSYPSISNPSVSLQRAYSQTSFVGDRIVTLNLEIRDPLVVVERGFKFYSLFLSQIYTTMFVDFSRVEWKGDSVNYPLSVGIELSFDMTLWSSFRFTLTGGIAFSTLDINDFNPRYFFRIGKTF